MNYYKLESVLKGLRNLVFRRDMWAPNSFAIELSAACNRSCVYCPVAEHPAKQRIISTESLNMILGRLQEYGWHGWIDLVRYNEPLLIRELPAIIKTIKQALPKCRIKCHTNGDKLTMDKARELIAAGVDKFIVTQHPPSTDEWYENISRIKAAFPKNVTLFAITRWVNRGGAVDNKNLPQHKNKFRHGCYETQHVEIDMDGNIILCNQDFFKQHTLGNLKDKSVRELYYDPHWLAYRAALRSAKPGLAICKACMASN